MLGATLADAIFFVLTYYGVARLVTSAERGFLFLLGGVLLLYLALLTIKNARNLQARSSPARLGRWSSTSIGNRPFLLGLAMGITNPYQLGWWIAIGAGMVSDFGASVAVGFFVGILAWTLIFTSLVHEGVARYQRLSPLIAYASAAIMAGFGLWFLGEGLLTTFL